MLRGAALFAVTLAVVSTADARPRHPPSRISRLTVGTRVDSSGPRAPAPPASREAAAPSVAITPPEPSTVSPPSTAPPNLRLTETSPAPPRRWGQLAGGLVLFFAGWGADLGLSYGLGPTVQRPWLAAIPLIGPLAQMGESWSVVTPTQTGNAQVDAEANARIAEINRATQTAAYVVLAVDFALQLAGLTMAIVGSLPPRRARPADRPTAAAATASIAPSSSGRAALTITF
jgi:hypothetical protein